MVSQKFTNCSITISGVTEGIGDTQNIDSTTVHIYDSGYVQIPEISSVVPPHRVVNIKTNTNHDCNL